nr:DUF1565 domain-containing protein [Anaerolineae bacterium]
MSHSLRRVIVLAFCVMLLAVAVAPLASADAPTGEREPYSLPTSSAAVAAEAAMPAAGTLSEAWVSPTGDDTAGTGSQSAPFKTIQKGLDEVAADGTVYVYPGTYNETAANRVIFNGGTYTFGLFMATNGVTLQGVKADGSPITAYTDVATTITTNATNNFGHSGIWVEADDVTIAGLGIDRNIPGDNKTIEVVGNNFTLKASTVTVPDGWGSVYINDWRYNAATNTSYLTKYTIDGNWIKDGSSVDVGDGAGYTGAAADRKITNNKFDCLPGAYWPVVSFNGVNLSVGWFNNPVGGATIAGNDFSGCEQYIRARGTYDAASFDWAAYWTGNTFDKAVLATTDGNPASVRTYAYNDWVDVRRIGGTIQKAHSADCAGADCNGEVDNAQAGDTVLVKAGAYAAESLTLNKALSLVGPQKDVAVSGRTPGGSAEATITGQATLEAANVTINGFTLTNPGAAYAVVVNPAATDTTIKHNLIDNVGSPSFTPNVHAIIASNGADGLQVLNNRFSNISAGAYSLSAVGILDSGASNSSTGLVVSGNTFTGIASATKGGYGVILNNKIGAPGAQITNNSFSNITGGWVHAVGLETKTPNAVVTGNTFTGLAATGMDESAVFFEKNADGASVTVQGNQFNGSGYYGVAIHPNDLPGGSNGLSYTVTAENNWWGSACGPSSSVVNVGPNVDYTPFWLTPTGVAPIIPPAITDGMSASDQCLVINSARPESPVNYPEGGAMPGGVIITNDGVTINLNGATIGAGSPAFTIDADDVTVNGPGIYDGNGTDPGVLVKTGADNFTLNGVELKNWADGVLLEGSHESLKLVNNWLHDNATGFRFNSATALTGVVTINGNLFNANSGAGIQNDSTPTIPAEYNSWGNIGGAAAGDGIGGNVDAAPFTFVEVYTDAAVTAKDVEEGETFTVQVLADAAGMYAVQYRLTYDPTLLQVQTPVANGVFGDCTVNTATAGVITSYCAKLDGTADVNATGAVVNTITFKVQPDATHAGEDSWVTYLDLVHDDGLAGAARDGIKAWVNNAGFGDPSSATKDIT